MKNGRGGRVSLPDHESTWAVSVVTTSVKGSVKIERLAHGHKFNLHLNPNNRRVNYSGVASEDFLNLGGRDLKTIDFDEFL